MSVKNENAAGGESVVLERPAAGGVYASLFKKINLKPVSELSALDIWQDAQAMSDATADERLTAGMQVFLECLTKAGSKVEKLDKNLIDHHIAELDYQISRQLDAVMHHEDFQAVESLWRGVKSLVDKTDFRQNVKVELLDMSKEDLRQDFEDCPEIIQSGLYKHTYIDEYDTPGGEPIAALISAYEFDASAQDVTLLRNISKVSAAAHMPFIGSAGPKFFLKDSMEEVAAIKDIGNYFDRAEYIKWKSFRETDNSRYIGLVMPRVLGRLPYGPDTVVNHWLDHRIKDDAMLLIVGLQIDPAVSNNTAETAVALLLGNRLTQEALEPLALLHRPDAAPTGELRQGMNMAAYNVPLKENIVKNLWLAGLTGNQRAEVIACQNAHPAQSVEDEAVISLDTSMGHAGAAAPWLVIAAATEIARQTQLPQMIICGDTTQNVLWSTLITPIASRQEMDP